MKPKVLCTTADASPQSGAFRSLLRTSRGLGAYGYQPILALHRDAADTILLSDEGHKRTFFFDLPRARRGQSIAYYCDYLVNNLRAAYEVSRVVRREEVSVVHVNEVFDVYAALAARIAGVPCVWHVRTDLESFPFRPLLARLISSLANRVITVSRSTRRQVFEIPGVSTEKVSVIYNPAPDRTRFHPQVDGARIRKEFDLGPGTFLVLMVAKLVECKGHKTLIRAIPDVLSSFPNTVFMVVGGELDGVHHREYARELKALPAQVGVDRNVCFAGFRRDVPQIMAASDVVVHCSVNPDPFPGVVLQGMSIGVPVIASNLGGAKEQIENQVSGILVEPGDPSTLAEALCSLLQSQEKRSMLGQAGLQRVRGVFSAECYFRSLSRLYDQLG